MTSSVAPSALTLAVYWTTRECVGANDNGPNIMSQNIIYNNKYDTVAKWYKTNIILV
jgi:NADH:ubiquinone oxidoreductase subunit E